MEHFAYGEDDKQKIKHIGRKVGNLVPFCLIVV